MDWKTRYKIAVGTARGLHYLHKVCPRRIIHRDIKASNVLVTTDFEPQVPFFWPLLPQLFVIFRFWFPSTIFFGYGESKNVIMVLFQSKNFQISDFGLAKWLPSQWTHHSIVPIEGTFGYATSPSIVL